LNKGFLNLDPAGADQSRLLIRYDNSPNCGNLKKALGAHLVKQFILFMGLCLLGLGGNAQEHYVKKYRVEDGLPSDIVKACAQDSLGYFWYATDEGLVKYDGIRFTSYREAMHSNYAKGFLRTKDNRLLAFGDLDLIEIENSGDTVLFRSLCPVGRIANDSTLSYPKLLFEDQQRNLWISESQSVVKINRGSFKRYEFGLVNRSPQFLRSFSFFEDRQGNLFTASFHGTVFRYNRNADTFDPVSEKLPSEIEIITKVNNRIIIGSSEGIFQADLPEKGGVTRATLKIKVPLVSYVAALPTGEYIITTHSNQHFLADFTNFSHRPLHILINNINHVYTRNESDVWISSNEGLIMMKENIFHEVNANVKDFIESIEEDPDGTIYYAVRSTLYSFNPITKANTVLLHLPSGYFQSLLFTKDGIWIANAFRVFLFDKGKIKKEFDFSKYGRFVTGLSGDADGNVWLVVPGRSEAYMIDRELNLRQFAVPLSNDGVVNQIRQGKEGIYITSAGKDSYLFFKAPRDTAFKNISVPFDLATNHTFDVTDIVFIEDRIWLSTSAGLLQLDGRLVTPINFSRRPNRIPVKTIKVHSESKLLIANAFGLFLYDINDGSTDLFTESSGLPSNTITRVHVSRDRKVWVGTSNGLCYSDQSLTELKQTSAPKFVSTHANGKKISLKEDTEVNYGTYLSIHVSSITFPENEIIFQYRFTPEDSWKISLRPDLNFADLRAGSHTLEVRAKKNGPYSWSFPSTLTFSIAKPFWYRWWFYVLCAIAAFALITLTMIWMNIRNQKKTLELQALIDHRTNALRASNQELLNLNLEKNNLISIVAHDLKSPLSQITGLLSLIRITGKVDEASAEHLSFIEASANRLNSMITKILDVNAIDSQSLNIKIEKISLSEMANNVADRFGHEAAGKKIEIVRHIENSVFAMADRHYMEQVLENLLSNAIKFSPLEKNVFINLKENSSKVICEIKDQGPGLTEDDQKKLFGKYQKLSARPTANETSTGLGLSIVKKFVVAMNGDIWCQSEQGKGASFYIAFSKNHL
jgi:signal transduction histidine kinase/ligand-binding sensor domain-containing protein